MKQINERIYQWSVFNEAKGLNFNGLYLKTPSGNLLVDPPPLEPADIEEIMHLGKPQAIYLTNKHHTRGSAEHRERWGAKLVIHEDDQGLMEIEVDGTYADGELIALEIEAINIPDSKTPGECAFFWAKQKCLILGDAIIGGSQGLTMLDDSKFKDPKLARIGLKALVGLEYDKLLLGDGESLLANAAPQVEAFIHQVGKA